MTKLVPGLTILVLVSLLISGCSLANQPPLISSLTASPERANPSGTCQAECVASDPDGDKLSFDWSANGGNILGEGSEITWVAPNNTGAYTITVTVTDGRGGEDTAGLTIVVATNQPPVIDSLTAESLKVRKATTSTIECIARDPDGDKLSYTWSASGGSISGEGATATWTAPNTYGIYTITVTVTDGRGGEATQSIDIIVTCCVGGGD